MRTESAVRPVTGAAAILEIIEWLSGDECHELDDAGLIAGLGRRLRSAGLPIDRLSLHLRTLHPEIFGRSVAWAPNEPVEVHDREHGLVVAAPFLGSPLRHVMETREPLSVRPGADDGTAWTEIDVFRGRRLAEIFIVPLCNADGPVSAAAFCTARAGGFSITARAALERIVPALRNACELRTLRQTELTLLDTYIGATTAQRILAGRIRRGQVESLEAALMLCDLRGFTDLSNRLPEARVLALLDTYFDRVVPPITAAGGEVLKFMGDAVLAFFHRDDAAAACAAALRAANDALDSLERVVEPDAELHAGIALHYGVVSYGNIGSGRRLDFTVIGPDVNLVSRIQAVCGTTGHPLLMSRRFTERHASGQTTSIGHHTLKGFAEPQELHAPRGSCRRRLA
ncbi:adenylate/guanylate cyclase domain-containing protein [Vineibacter terrae]|uniref:adenylate/guanylate cyclase domain-containing protein n=1 Tax=Vineibacter terrae TaxID=2586908 RepID=UPI001C49A108|nr:adenylate/guanylate cyclase domain-containing protein [Vineibacter terrae]